MQSRQRNPPSKAQDSHPLEQGGCTQKPLEIQGQLDKWMNQQSTKSIGRFWEARSRIVSPAGTLVAILWHGMAAVLQEGWKEDVVAWGLQSPVCVSACPSWPCGLQQGSRAQVSQCRRLCRICGQLPSIHPVGWSVLALRMACCLGRMCGQKGAFTQSLGSLDL